MTDGEAREMARELVRGSIVEDAVSQFIAQIIKHTHDERVKPLRRQVADLEAKLAKAVEALELLHDNVVEAWPSVANLGPVAKARATLAEIKGESHDSI